MASRFGGAWGALVLGLMIGGCGGPSDVADPSNRGRTTPDQGVKFVGFDASPPLVEALKRGQLQGLVLQNPLKMGETGVRTLVAFLEKKEVPKKISTGEALATPENMETSEIATLLNPPKKAHTTDTSLSGSKSKKYRIMVIPKGTTHEFWQSLHAGAAKAAEDLGVEIMWQGPIKEDDRTEQIKLVQSAVAARMDGIVLAPLDAHALVGPVERAVAAGIPVVIIDSDLNSEKKASFVATDNYHGGVLAAERLAELLQGQGRIILLRYAVGSESTERREKGFTDTIAKYPKIKYLSNDQYAGATSDSAQRVAQNLVTRYRGQIDGVFCPNESSTAGMLRALSEAGLLAGRR